MCSVFDQFLEMETFLQGDLNDVVRGISCHVSPKSPPSPPPPPPPFLQPSSPSDHLQITPFGDPFVTMTDPLLQDNNNNGFLIPKVFEDDNIIKNQCSIFPRIRISHSNIIHEVSPCNSPAMSARAAAAVTAAAAAASPRGIINVDTNSPRNCVLIDSNTFSSQIQISSPRSLSLKRRKSQAKKVVCIPAPAAMNSRSSGEVVPSDLWAWRKYGQKPIKGSPFPRGYYRCSSTKGCSARKQVERSRADPNMLVITYTSEHNHPWPIQRNALAGSTRSSSSSSSSPTTATNTPTKERKPNNNTTTHFPSSSSSSATAASVVKDEMELDDHNNQAAPYRPQDQPDDFFADLDELERDSLSILFSQGCVGENGGDREDKTTTADAFDDFFGWSGVTHNNNDRDLRTM